tara:strand:+ start:77 stop:679 length:603 start_codon:yes stop_codon:yes gene_type:complete
VGATNSPPIGVIDRFRSSLAQKGISITQLSEDLGVSRQAIYNWIKSGAISQRYIEPLCQILEIKAEWLLFGTPQLQDCTDSCYQNCELKVTLIDLLLNNRKLIVEHNILTQEILWHGDTINEFEGSELPSDTDSLREWIDPDYYHMFHHALLRYHLYKDRQKVIFPIRQEIPHKSRWLELEFESHCNNQIVIYSLQEFKA